MTDESPARPDDGGETQPLDAVDPVLNVFALANSMDLYRDHLDPPDRVLAWFRDGLERRIHLTPTDGGAIALAIVAGPWGDRDAGHQVAHGAPVSPADLKANLPAAVDAANGLTFPEPPPA